MAKVSVIVPVYNEEKFLNSCLESLTNQTLKDIEIIAINDGSTDSSLDVMERFLDKHMDFSKEEYELHYWKSENYRYVLLNNLVLVPSGETDLIRYKSTNSDYKIVASRGACKSSYLDAQMASQITLNSLIFNPDKLPNDASVDGIYKTVFGLKKQNKGKYTDCKWVH